jgi:phosphoserine phosphatase
MPPPAAGRRTAPPCRKYRASGGRRWPWLKTAPAGRSSRLKDVVKAGVRERFAELRRMGIRTVMITGDNPLTAAAIAAEAGWTTSSPKPRPRTSWR